MEAKVRAVEYLKKPYGRLVLPAEDGTFSAEIFEFPGCIAVGATAAEALANLEEVAVDWIEAALEQGQSIPGPMDSAEYSGKLVLRMPKGIHKRAAQCADREGVSLNSFIVSSVSEQVGARSRVLPGHFQLAQIAPPIGLYIQLFALTTVQSHAGIMQPITAASGQQSLGVPIKFPPERQHA